MTSPLDLECRQWAAGRRVAGLDEAGRGAWAGPVVAAAVVLPPDPVAAGQALAGVTDSKRLGAGVRAELAAAIRAFAQVGVGAVAAATIDRIGIVEATVQAMSQALHELPLPPDYLLIDHIPRPLGDWPQQRLPRGELASLSIAAASIVAKVHRDHLMIELEAAWPGYGFARHKGYGTLQHRAALARLGSTTQHRRTWAPLLQPRLPLASGKDG